MLPRVAGVSFLFTVVALTLGPAAQATRKTKFVSKRYHYSLVLPGGSSSWLNTPAIANWSGAYPPSLGNPAWDDLANEKTGRAWLIAAKRVAKGMTLEKWTAFTIARMNPSCSPLPWHSKTKLGGAPAQRYDVSCSEGRVITLTAIHAHRGYFFNCIPGTKTRRATERACSAVQRSFRFTSG